MHEHRIRVATPEDAAGILAIYAPLVRETAISFESEPPTEEQMRERIATVLRQHPWLVCAGGGEVLGYAYATAYRPRAAYQWSVESSIYAHPRARGTGVARELYGALLRLLRAQGYRVAYGVIALPNPASVRLHERFGFEPIGTFRAAGYKLGAWHDVLWMRKEVAPPVPSPAPPLPLPSLDPEVVAAALAGRR